MEQSSKEPEKRGISIGEAAISDMWNKKLIETLSASASNSITGDINQAIKQKPSQPANRGDEAYLCGVLAAMCAGHCKLKDIYKQVDQESLRTKIVAGFETTSKRYVLVPIELPFHGSMVPDDWFLELKARIVMECGE